MIKRFSLQLPTSHLVATGVLITAAATMPWPWWLRTLIGLAVAGLALVSFDNRLATEWVKLAVAMRRPRRLPAHSPAEHGSIAMPGEDVAVRWEGDTLTAIIALHPRPFTPTYAANRHTVHEDTVSTALVSELLGHLDVPATADIVSAGWRVARRSPPAVQQLYEQTIATDPCPAARRTWLLVRVDPVAALAAAAWRGEGISGVADATVAAATRLAEALSKRGVDARVAGTFSEYDELTDPGEIIEESWSYLRGRGSYTTVFSAPGGPDQWWRVRADRTVTRVRVTPGRPPRSTVALTTIGKMRQDPVGWTRLLGGQLAGLTGQTPVADADWNLPIGSAGMLVGTEPGNDLTHIYLPLDSVDSVLHVTNPAVTVQVVLRSAACGAIICLPPDPAWTRIAATVHASSGPAAHLFWPTGARTWLVSKRTSHIVQFLDHEIVTENGRIPLNWIHPREEIGLATR